MRMDEMEAEPSSSSPPALSGGELITSVNHNDVLMGRGTRPNEFVGNLRFRNIIEQRNEEYKTVPQNKAKRKIAREVFDRIHALGGRFLKEVDETAVNDAEEAVWIEVEESVALEKCKQALREQKRGRQRSSNGDRGRNHGGGGGGDGSLERNGNDLASPAVSLPQCSASLANRTAVAPPPPSLSIVQGDPTSFPMHSWDFNFVLPSMFDKRLMPFLAPTLALQQPVTMNRFYPSRRNVISHRQNDLSVLPRAMHAPTDRIQQGGLLQDMHRSVNEVAESAYQNSLEDIAMQGLLQLRTDSVAYQAGRSSSDALLCVDGRNDGISSARSTESSPSSCENAWAQALFTSFQDRSRFTEEQVAMERAMMTDEERSEALSDLFGKQCAVDIHHSKRARRDFDHKAVTFLVNQMRLEIERIPLDRKRALVEAQDKCRADEFSDARLERFLRCEGMNVKLGAHRFVNYWESRRDVFGPEKYLLRMTLSHALREDLVALETGVQQILPHRDSSGRQMLYWELRRHTREGYTSESLLRAIWYVMEVLAQENNDINSGAVMVIWDKNTSVWDFDRSVYDRMVHFEANCWPVKLVAHHICCPSVFGIHFLKPIIYALVDKRARSRAVIHDVPDSRMLEDLSSYGILKYMLPTEMGGAIQLNPSNWIANRRAVELEEI